ncbi:DUF4123 domain-containing protein [Shewanella sp. VB17]|uniref:DUF4123 domain-containing protein n=1 Tax=Shewanella sp. VB17 TaxID=2739432 RepID=UPI00156766EB|nr:DUF4123 domain-containing protein [Shewanella sp. VB17]NRD73013.1 DUF4123 domain-containing protein [Shewanella sp. VB17]
MIHPVLDISSLSKLTKQYLYLLLDGSKIEHVEKELYLRLGNPLYQPIYLLKPYDVLKEVTPCLIQLSLANPADNDLLAWFIDNKDKRWGYLFSSKASLDIQTERLRRQIQIITPYGSKALYKLADPEAAWRLFSAKSAFLWQGVEQVWIPSTMGWHSLINDHYPLPVDPLLWQLTDTQWHVLGEVSYQNCLNNISKHLHTWFPDTLIKLAHHQHARDVRYWADFARAQGFTLEQDLLYFFNVLAYLGEDVFADKGEHLHPEIWPLIHNKSLQTPSQRIAHAAQLAAASLQDKKPYIDTQVARTSTHQGVLVS